MIRIIVLRELLTHLSCGHADHRIGIGVIIDRTAKDNTAQSPFLNLAIGPAFKGFRYNITKKSRQTLAVAEKRVCEQDFQVIAYTTTLLLTRRMCQG
jgi:hypothetical protein